MMQVSCHIAYLCDCSCLKTVTTLDRHDLNVCCSVPGGSLTDKWYTGMLKGFEVHFRMFWYIDGWVIVTYPMRPICKVGCILENLAKKAPNLPQIGCFLQKNGTEMGHKITLFEV